MNIFSHSCEEDGVEVSYFVSNDDVCGKHESHDEDENDSCDDCCCDEQSDDNNCCSTSAELVKVDLDFLNKLIVKAVLIPTDKVQPIWVVREVIISTELRSASGTDPPPKLGQDILIDIQKWMI